MMMSKIMLLGNSRLLLIIKYESGELKMNSFWNHTDIYINKYKNIACFIQLKICNC